MITRIVKLTIKENRISDFIEIFESSKDKIISQSGCHHVEMLQDINDPRLCFTYSFWDSQDSLDTYRKSELFGSIWPKTKSLFDGRPEAWSLKKT